MDEENNKAEDNGISSETGGVSLSKEGQSGEATLNNEETVESSTIMPAAEPAAEPVAEQVAEAAPAFGGALAPVEAPKKSNRNLIIGVVVLVIIAAVGVIAGPKLMGSPLTKVITAFAKTTAEAGTTVGPMENASGMAAALKTVEDGKTSLKGQLSLVEAPPSVDPDGTSAGMGVGYELDIDMPGKLFYLDLGMMMDAAKIINAEFYGSADTFDFAIPALVNGYFRVPLTNVGKAYKDSMFYQYQPMEVADDYSFSFFDATETEGVSVPYTAVALKHAEWTKRFQKDITVEKSDQAEIQVGEEMLPCQGYAIAMTDEKANAFFQDYITYWQSDEDAKALIDEGIKAYAAGNSYSGYMTPAEMEAEMHADISEILAAFQKMKLNNMTFDCYIDKNDIVRQFAFAGDVTSDGETVHTNLDGLLAGVGRAIDDMNLDLSMESEGNVSTLNFKNKQHQDGENIVTEGTFLMGSEYEDAMSSQWNMTYNTKDSGYSLDADIRATEMDTITISSKGVLEIPEKGKSFHLNMDTIDFGMTSADGEEHMIFKGLFSLDQLTEAVKIPTGTEYKLLELDEAGLQAIVMEAYGNIMRLGEELSGILN